MKTGNVILAIFLWIVAGILFYYSFMFSIFGGNTDICILVSIILIILGFMILWSGLDKEEIQKISDSSSSEEKCQMCGKPKDGQQFYYVNRKFICGQCADEVKKKSQITHTEKSEEDESLKVLKLRYAKGEITKEQFEQMKKDLID